MGAVPFKPQHQLFDFSIQMMNQTNVFHKLLRSAEVYSSPKFDIIICLIANLNIWMIHVYRFIVISDFQIHA